MSKNPLFPPRRTWALPGAAALACLFPVASASAGDLHLEGLASAATHDRFIVTYRQGSAESSDTARLSAALRSAAAAIPGPRGRLLGVRAVRRLAVGSELVKTDRPLDRAEAELLMRHLAAEPSVASVEVDQLVQATLTPDDPLLKQQWAFGTTAAGINVRPAWDDSTGAGVVVAVIDTGITPHPDLQANVLPGYDFISEAAMARDGDGRDDNPADEGDWYGPGECRGRANASSWHGTHVAGTVAALTDNSAGVAGTAFNAKILPVRVLGKCGGYLSDISDAIVWASGGTVSGVPANLHPAEVINMSLGGRGECTASLRDAINGAVSRGTTVVVSAGNSATDVSGQLPANCPNVIAVAATDVQGALAPFSNYGPGVDVSAPGVSILSTFNTGTTTPGAPNFGFYSGTSMAAPHVAGVAALMQAVAPSALSPAGVDSLLRRTATPPSNGCEIRCGGGIVNAAAAVAAAKAGDTGEGEESDPVLVSGVPRYGLKAATGESLYFAFVLPPDRSRLKVSITGGVGNADLYLRNGSEPTDLRFVCRSRTLGNEESCGGEHMAGGAYYVRIKATSAFSGLTLVAEY